MTPDDVGPEAPRASALLLPTSIRRVVSDSPAQKWGCRVLPRGPFRSRCRPEPRLDSPIRRGHRAI